MKNFIFVMGFIGLLCVSVIAFVSDRLLFGKFPEVENVISIIWTVAITFGLYRLLHIFPSQGASRETTKKEMYSALIFLCEMFAVLVMLFSAIFLSVTLTSPVNNDSQLSFAIGTIGLLALALPVSLRLMRLYTRRTASVDKSQYGM